MSSKYVHHVTDADFQLLKDVTGDPREGGRVATLVSRELSGSQDIMAGFARFDPGEHRRPHHHTSASEIYVVLKGEVVIHIDGDDVTADYGTSVYVPENAVHSIRNDGDVMAEVLWAFNLPEREEHGGVYDDHVWPELA